MLTTCISASAATPAGRNLSVPVITARQALFERSELDVARAQAQAALRVNPRDVEALFVEMETATLEADNDFALAAALRLCELRGAAQHDDRVAIAAARVLDLAANTPAFRAAVPRIQALLARPHAQAGFLQAALVAAARDGLPGLSARQAAHEAGLLTDWRVAGPFGKFPNLDFDRPWAPEHDALALPMSAARAVEELRFDDGEFRLPAYFDRGGVFYAAADAHVPVTGDWLLRAETAGTLEVFVDDVSVLRKDDRFRATPETARHRLRLKPGTHRVLVKFIASALPFRIALTPVTAWVEPRPAARIDYAPEAAYVAAARKYWDGDFTGAIASLRQLRAQHDSAVAAFLAYQAWMHVAEDSPEAPALLNAALKATPGALAAEYELAARAFSADRGDEALTRLQRVLDKRENFAPAQSLMGQLAIRMHWPVRAASALQILLSLHPSCDALLQAQRFFARHARFDQAHKLTRELENCSPETLAHVRVLGEEGSHAEAAAVAQQAVAQRPLDREARELLARELALSGNAEGARTAMRELATLAPNSNRYRELAARAERDPNSLLDNNAGGPPKPAFGLGGDSDSDPFYTAFRRDGQQMVRQTAERRFSGGPAVKILDDRVARLWPDGSVSLYVHQLTRVLDRGGVETYGEVELPRGAEVLELRTLKADGGIAEPEFAQQKATISMPGLLPGDAVDEEYVVHYAGGGIAAHPAAFQHTFGSFRAPILFSRFVVITPAGDRSIVSAAHGPEANVISDAAATTRVWEKNDIAQSVEEVASARGNLLPAVRLEPALPGGWDDVRRHNLDAAIDALRIGPRLAQAAERLRGADDESRARALYRQIVSTIRSASAGFGDDLPPAEATLALGAGSRTAALLAVARAAGLKADLVLARAAGFAPDAPGPSLHAYTRPLVRFRLRDHDVIADAETEGLAFGALPPSLERHDALLIALPENSGAVPAPSSESAILQLPDSAAPDQSVARGEVTLDADGNLAASTTIVLGVWRGAQMRSILAGIEPARRDSFYQQLAARIFPGAEDVTGETRNERDPDHPLELFIRCRAPRFVSLARGSADLDQLVPALGLKKMYVSGPSRQFPLFVDTPLFETTTFRVHLPPGVTVTNSAGDVELAGEFGKYEASFREIEPGLLEIRRAFHIPVQVVPPQRFDAFARFAVQIDDLERQRLTLQRETAQLRGAGQ